MSSDKIVIKGARQHNLKNITVEIPRDQLVVITGLSGSGKSSLAFDTVYAEGQRRYVESLSAYARQFLGQMDKPDVDFIEGLSPAIAIDQKTTSKNPRSTVGTVTEIYDYLRLLYARIGHPHCPQCGRPVVQQSVDQIVDQVLARPEGTRIQVLGPVVQGRKGEYKKVLDEIRREGYVRVRVDGTVHEITEEIDLEKNRKHSIEVVVDRLVLRPDIRRRLADSLETALRLGDGLVVVDLVGEGDLVFSERLACPECGISLTDLAPRMFSFNSPFGACPNCDGLGVRIEVDPDLVLDPRRTLRAGAVLPWSDSSSQWHWAMLQGLAERHEISLDLPVGKWPEAAQRELLYGTGDATVRFWYENRRGEGHELQRPFEGVIPELNRRYRETSSEWARSEIEKFMSERPCAQCGGARLKRESLGVTVGELNIHQFTRLSVGDSLAFLDQLDLTERERIISHQILKEVRARLGFLLNVGLDYLTLDRQAGTLSGGEAQRIRLATQIGSGLVGVLYILDEPSIGLHQRDNRRLLNTLKGLRDLGNTLLVVEHDEETMREADWIIDMGPGAGTHGGEVVAAGTYAEICREQRSLTGQYLSGARYVPVPVVRRKPNGKYLEVKGAREHNLKDIDVRIPLGVFVCVTGVSGSGKSTLVNEILYRRLAHELNGAGTRAGSHDALRGTEYLDKVIDVDQSPIGRTPRSNPATYTGAFDLIREIFAQTPEAKMRGYSPGRFSFNVKGGRCEACQGDGMTKIEMHFLPDVYVPCEVCGGRRYNRETLEVHYKGKNIADVLDMRVEEAQEFFQNHPRLKRKIETLYDVGLGYVKLGQPATELSGGEAQRVKLATELSRRSTGRTLYILDEPTTGLHFADTHKLLEVLQRLVDTGNTVLVIEHNLDVIKSADYLVDLGPEGGYRGGTVVAAGTPEEVAAVPASFTGQFVRPLLEAAPAETPRQVASE